MGTPQGPQKCPMKFLNFCLCASNDPNAPKKTCGTKCLDCLKPNTEEPETDDGSPQRESWGNRCTFFITTLGMSVGLGQVWRFPTLAYAKGGGAFLIMYGVVIFLFGNALFFFEVSNGQYTSKNPLKVFDKVPLFQGIGWSMIAYSYLFCTYYSHMVSFSLYYLFNSFKMPWTVCPSTKDDIYDSYNCMPFPKNRNSEFDGIVCGSEGFLYNRTKLCEDKNYTQEQQTLCCKFANVTKPDECASLFNATELCKKREYPTAYFWNHVVNKIFREDDPNYGNLGPINWYLFGFSFLTWFLAYVVLYKGLKSLGVMMYIMVPLPYIVLIIMLGVVAPQKGAATGMKNFFVPEPRSFINLDIWRVAAEQAFYSIGVAMGPLITFGSYAKFNSPSHIDGALICLCIFLTSVLCSLVVFSVLGFLSVKSGRPFNEVCEIGPGLVFIVYPQSLELLPGAPFFSILFYLMLINLGLSSVTGIIETVSSAVYDIYPSTRRFKYLVNLGVLCSSFLVGLPITARGGLSVYQAFDTYSAGIPLIPMCALELLVIIYIYGLGRFCEDINFMLGFYPNRYYRYNWMLGPIILTAIFISGLIKLKVPYEKPWLTAVGWLLFLAVVIWIFVGAFYNIAIYKKKNKLKDILKPPPDHGPKKDADRESRNTYSIFIYERPPEKANALVTNIEAEGIAWKLKNEKTLERVAFWVRFIVTKQKEGANY